MDSMTLKPLFWKYKIKKTSNIVITIPARIGIPKSNCKASADPITSAKSQAAMAISQTNHKKMATGFEKASPQACAKSRPEATPSFKAKCCKMMAKMLETRITERRV